MINGQGEERASGAWGPRGGEVQQRQAVASARERDRDRRGGCGVEPGVEDGPDAEVFGGRARQAPHLAAARVVLARALVAGSASLP